MSFQGFCEDDVVISGVGCKLPECDNLQELEDKLFKGVNFVTSNDPKQSSISLENVPNFSGKIRGLKNFDNLFFSVSNIMASNMDLLTKQILERTLEAVIDAGLNPSDLQGTNATAYSALTHSDFDFLSQTDKTSGYLIVGRSRPMCSNRASWWLDLSGSSVTVDGGWSNGILNLVQGWEAIRKGRCDTAVVSVGNLTTLMENNLQFNDFKSLSPDGACKAYDDSANGWCRSEAIVVFVLQKASIAKRCYAVIDDAFHKFCGDESASLNNPSQQQWETLFKEFYAKSKVDVNDVCYIEGQGAGIKGEDACELNAINSIFCHDRSTPLLLGSIKSNIGHTEAASASCSIIKAILCLEKGIIPKNLHYRNPNSNCIGLIEGNIKIVDKNISIPDKKRIAVNAHGIANAYGHVVLSPNPKTVKRNYDGIPRLVLLSARTDDLMDDLLQKVEKSTVDLEQIALIHDVFTQKIDKHLSRGYTILPKTKQESVREHQVFESTKRPIWLIFSGMGSQWCKMGKRMMDFPVFRESIEKCHKILEKKELNLIEIITTDDPKIFDNILHSFVGIAAIQIAFVDILNVLGIVPDGMIGHSVGELGCAYADGCLTAEQTILCSYSRGRASIESPLIRGFMAAIGKGYNEIKDELPEGIEVACRNSANSCTISGPAELVQDYVKELQDRKIFATTVNSSNIAYHSRYIQPAGPKLLEYLREIVPEPKLRSEKWVSTSCLEENWNSDLAKYCSAEYHTNNFLSPVYFEERSQKIPTDAICIEIAPHGLLQAILKRSLGKDCVNIPLANRTAKDPLIFFLQAVGKMYMAGLSPMIKNLYPKIDYPVSRGTLPLSHLVTWQHEAENAFNFRPDYEKEIKYCLKDHFSKTARDAIGYLINGKNYYPLSVFLDLTWKAFASLKKIRKENCPVLFEGVRVKKFLVVPNSEMEMAIISVGLASGRFEIYTDEIAVKGNISLIEDITDKTIEESDQCETVLNDEIYDDFKRRGFDVGSDLKCLESIEINKNEWKGKIKSSCDWLQIMESMIQLETFEKGKDSRSILFPQSIETLRIIPTVHSNWAEHLENLEVNFNDRTNILQCGGITMKGLKFQTIKNENTSLRFESTKFVPFENSLHWELWEMVDFCYQIISDNLETSELSISQITNGFRVPAIGSYLEKKFTPCKVVESNKRSDLAICDELSLDKAVSTIDKKGFILVKLASHLNLTVPKELDMITKFSTNNGDFVLLSQKQELNDEVDYIIAPNNESISKKVMKDLENTDKIKYLISFNETEEGFEEFKKRVKTLKAAKLRWLLILDEKAPEFNPKNQIYLNQLQKGLKSNIYCNGSWGSYYLNIFDKKNVNVDVQSALINDSSELKIFYFGMNFDENLVPQQPIEYSGILEDGTKVMGIAEILENKRISTVKLFQWKLPKNWTFEDGATVPVSYALAYYCLNIKGLWNRYKTVLVTDGLRYNGQAAISVALSLGFRVYVTVNNDEEIPLLRKLFPNLNESDIISHDDNDFDVQLGLKTKGDYFDMILNNVENEKLVSVINCLGFGGTLFHFGKEDFRKNVKMGTNIFLSSVGFYGVSPDVLNRLTSNEKDKIRNYLLSAIENKTMKPLPKTIYGLKDIERMQTKKELVQNRNKILFTSNVFKEKSDKLRIDPKMSYIIIGDGSDFWIDIAQWLVTRNVQNIVVGCQNVKPYCGNLQKIKVQTETDIAALLDSAKKLAPIAAVFVIKMNESSGIEFFTDLDKNYTDQKGHLIVISQKESKISYKCAERMSKGYPSTHFVWKTEGRLTNENLNTMEMLSGQDSVIQISDHSGVKSSDCTLCDILPSSVEGFFKLGSTLKDKIQLIELPTLGQKCSEINFPPLFVLPGLKNDDESRILDMAKKLFYPVVLIKLPHNENHVTIEEWASIILPNIQNCNKSAKVYNILGIGWGSYVAIELTRLVEKSGGNVSLMLIDGPLKTLKDSLMAKKSLEHDLLNTIGGVSKKDVSSFSSLIHDHLIDVKVSPEQQKQIKKALIYVYQNMKAMLNYDYSNYTLKGPITILKTLESSGDMFIKKICNNVSVRQVKFDNKEMIDVINGSVIIPDMNEDTINQCSWKLFEEFLINDKREAIKNEASILELIKSGRQSSFAKYLN